MTSLFQILLGLVWLMTVQLAAAAPSIALGYEPKYAAGFTHFAYVDATAPKRGSLTLSAIGNFDSLNPFLLKGIAAVGISDLVFETLMEQSLDEPFSQVDALTAESLRAEVVDIWSAQERNPSSILMVSHDIKEVAYMADRIVILSAHPGRIRTIVDNHLPRPRDYRAPAFLRLVDQLHELITGMELPDVPAGPAPGRRAVEPLPNAAASEVVGLLEYLDARGGKEDIFAIAKETHIEFGHVLAVVEAAEMLDFVDTPKRQVLLDVEGRRFVKASPEERKVIWQAQLLKLPLFALVQDLLRQQPGQAVDRELILETLIMHMPQEDYEKTFDTFIGWARYGNLFAYDETSELISPQEPLTSVP